VDIWLEKERSMRPQYPFTLVTTPFLSDLKIRQSTASLDKFNKDYRITTLDDFKEPKRNASSCF
jgi:hypothetical protein